MTLISETNHIYIYISILYFLTHMIWRKLLEEDTFTYVPTLTQFRFKILNLFL